MDDKKLWCKMVAFRMSPETALAIEAIRFYGRKSKCPEFTGELSTVIRSALSNSARNMVQAMADAGIKMPVRFNAFIPEQVN